jgi:hypothetical protein
LLNLDHEDYKILEDLGLFYEVQIKKIDSVKREKEEKEY